MSEYPRKRRSRVRRKPEHLQRPLIIEQVARAIKSRLTLTADERAVLALQTAGGHCSVCGKKKLGLIALAHADGSYSAVCVTDLGRATSAGSSQTEEK